MQLGCKLYSTAVDVWSLGCIMAELLSKEPLLNGRTEIDQLDKMFKLLGTPSEKIWPGFSKLPAVQKVRDRSRSRSGCLDLGPSVWVWVRVSGSWSGCLGLGAGVGVWVSGSGCLGVYSSSVVIGKHGI
jgi:serine/threonine protein kinase